MNKGEEEKGGIEVGIEEDMGKEEGYKENVKGRDRDRCSYAITSRPSLFLSQPLPQFPFPTLFPLLRPYPYSFFPSLTSVFLSLPSSPL